MKKVCRRVFAVLTGAAFCLAAHFTAMAQAQEPARILATGVFASTMRSLTGAFEDATGYKLQVSIANAGQVAARVTAGEPADIVMTSSASTKALAKLGVLDPNEVVIGEMQLGVAVASEPLPDVATAETFRSLLLAAEKVAYIDPSGGGTSGPHFEKMFAAMGITGAIHAKAVLCRTGADVVKAVASREAAVGMAQASELVGAEEIKFAGLIPASLNLTTVYSASLTPQSKDSKAAAAFLEFITSPIGSERLRRAGWTIDR